MCKYTLNYELKFFHPLNVDVISSGVTNSQDKIRKDHERSPMLDPQTRSQLGDNSLTVSWTKIKKISSFCRFSIKNC